MDYRETSQLVTLFTREKGKMPVLAKGARLAKSQFGATLQPMAYIQAIIYYKPTREIQTLSETAHIKLFPDVGAGLEKLTVGIRMIEFVQALLQVEEQNEDVFNLVVYTMERLEVATANVENIWLYFQIKLAGLLGFQPFVERKEVESIEGDMGYLAFETGAVSNRAGPDKLVARASRTALRAFAILVRADIDTVQRMHLEDSVLHELSMLVDKYIRFHVDEAYPDRSERVIAQLKDRKKRV